VFVGVPAIVVVDAPVEEDPPAGLIDDADTALCGTVVDNVTTLARRITSLFLPATPPCSYVAVRRRVTLNLGTSCRSPKTIRTQLKFE